jgi:hypothetical protein
MCAFLRARCGEVYFDALSSAGPKRKLYLCERWGFQPPHRLPLGPAAYQLPSLTLAWHPDLVKLVAVSIPSKRRAAPILHPY